MKESLEVLECIDRQSSGADLADCSVSMSHFYNKKHNMQYMVHRLYVVSIYSHISVYNWKDNNKYVFNSLYCETKHTFVFKFLFFIVILSWNATIPPASHYFASKCPTETHIFFSRFHHNNGESSHWSKCADIVRQQHQQGV